jgi:hypothetical protein
VSLQQQGVEFYKFNFKKLSVAWAIEYLRKQIRTENSRKNKKTILKQENINDKTDTIIVIGKSKEKIEYAS